MLRKPITDENALVTISVKLKTKRRLIDIWNNSEDKDKITSFDNLINEILDYLESNNS